MGQAGSRCGALELFPPSAASIAARDVGGLFYRHGMDVDEALALMERAEHDPAQRQDLYRQIINATATRAVAERHAWSSMVKAARETQRQTRASRDLVELTKVSLAVAASARDDAARSERFTRRMSHASLWVSIASLTAALASLVVALLVS